MNFLYRAEHVAELPSGKHSTKGIGKTGPDPSEAVEREDGVIVPMGSLVTDELKSDLLYNEYIVYNILQVNCQYLVKIKRKLEVLEPVRQFDEEDLTEPLSSEK